MKPGSADFGIKQRGDGFGRRERRAIDENEVASDAKSSRGNGTEEIDGVGEGTCVGHESGRGNDAFLVCADDSAVDTTRETEIVCIDDEASHATG